MADQIPNPPPPAGGAPKPPVPPAVPVAATPAGAPAPAAPVAGATAGAPAPAAAAAAKPAAKKDDVRIAPPQKTYVPRPGLMDQIKDSQIWRSIFRHGYPNTVRNRSLAVLSNVFLHLHPVNVRSSGLRLSFTWCMGGLTFFLFLVEVITGVLLMFYYRPTGEYAYQDIIAMAEHVPMGIMREIHRWAAHAMVITVWLHMFRVFMTGSYKPPREFNWNIGVILLVLTLLLSFTGYLLPWDQLAIWAITVGSNMARATPIAGYEGPLSSLITIDDVKLIHSGDDARFALLGGRFVGEATLLRFYVLHCIFIPLVATILMAVHFWRIRKDGGISGPL